jgi:hypothetical protein
MSQKINMNPFAFAYTGKNKIKFHDESYGHLRVSNQISGETYLKCTYIVYFRTHDGYCSETEDPDDAGFEHENSKIVNLYFSVPEDLKDSDGSFNADLLDGEAKLINSDKTEQYFLSWSEQSSCCGVCGYTDLYQPQYIEYIKIV